MMREVHPGLFVGDGDSINGPLKALAGYRPGPFRRKCNECGDEYFSIDHDGPHRCLDCALIEITTNWFIIHAAKEPWHRDALGYTGRGAPPDDPEYLVARRGNELMLNLVDMASFKEQYTNPIFEAAFEAIDKAIIHDGKKVLVHCNEGKSRAPTIALLWLGMDDRVPEFQSLPFDAARAQFTQTLYPEYEPGAGVEAYARARWGFVEEADDWDPIPS